MGTKRAISTRSGGPSNNPDNTFSEASMPLGLPNKRVRKELVDKNGCAVKEESELYSMNSQSDQE